METGTINASAVIGRYLTTVAMTTNKFHVPFFVTSDLDSDPTQLMTKYNVVAVLPVEFQIQSVTVDLIRALGWSSVAVLYAVTHGSKSFNGVISTSTRATYCMLPSCHTV